MTNIKKPVVVKGDFAYITLTKGYVAVIDVCDVEKIKKWNWHAKVDKKKDGSIRTVYAYRMENRKSIALHRFILNPDDELEVDHKDGNGLNNIRSNLRSATKSQNIQNHKTRNDNKSGIKGVSWSKKANKWMAQICLNQKVYFLGRFDDVNDAAEAYAKASKEIHGEFGRLL